ncbi:MAG TPA: RuBisCO large subunit C-terminal-like domain-containing protein [Nitrospiraceae bacterium]|nr:RuBisCO large subunit C-terminal-like domain-containing protein [Nitrospiraceae bacterium]
MNVSPSTSLSDSLSGARLSVVYAIRGDEGHARRQADLICIDQTVEAADEIIPAGPIRDQLLGRIESFEATGAGSWTVRISFPIELAQASAVDLLHLIYGTTSLKRGIRVTRIDLPEQGLDGWTGPRFGQAGLRTLLGIPHRPLVCAVLKPLGLPVRDLADLAYQFASAGVDLVKDDQGLNDQPFCRFEDRVRACAEAVTRANRETGHHCLYAPHIGAAFPAARDRALFAKAGGAGALLVCPGLTGYETLRLLASDPEIKLPILSHPALLGAYATNNETGIAPALLYGQLPRLMGADISLYPTYGGDYAMTREDCLAIARATSEPFGGTRSLFPSAAGRMGFEQIAEMASLYGSDVVYILGSRIQKHPDGLVNGCRQFIQEISRSLTSGRQS